MDLQQHNVLLFPHSEATTNRTVDAEAVISDPLNAHAEIR